MSTLLGSEEDMNEQSSRDYGREAVLRRLGALARRRREEMGFSRAAFVEHSGIRSDASIRDFEYGKLTPQGGTQAKLERALGWSSGAIERFLSDESRKASEIRMEDLDEFDSATFDPMAKISTVALLQEVIRRLSTIQGGMGVPGQHALAQEMYGLAAMGHKPEHLDEDGDDDISGFGTSAN